MRRKSVDKSWSKHNVPMEIWLEILPRLPARSLVRFRCVSRSWKTVIDDPDFCWEHLVRCKNNRDETHLLMVQGGGAGQCFVRCSNSMKISRSLGCLGKLDKKIRQYTSTVIPGYNGIWNIWFSVDGLVMLKCTYDYTKLILWNPSIRKYRLVPHSQGSEFLELGLGFDSLSKDYKLVRVTQHNAGSVDIYTIGTGSWRTVAASQGMVTSIWFWRSWVRPSVVYFKGCLYIRSKTKLISFDLSREVFKSVDLPKFQNRTLGILSEFITLVDSGSSMAIIQNEIFGGCSIWVLDENGAESSWSMRYTFPIRVPHFLYLKKNGDLLFKTPWKLRTVHHVVSYNIHTEEERQINFSKLTHHIYGYKESLVLLN